MSAKAKKVGKRRPILMVALLAAVIAAFLLLDLAGGLGLGLFDGSPEEGTVEQKEESTDTEPQPTGPADAGTSTSVVVTGDQCAIAGAAAVPCAEACQTIAADVPKTSRLEIDATSGMHQVVEALKACLGGQGYAQVRVSVDEGN